MMGKILITGAAGFIGSNLVEYLLLDGQNPSTLRLLLAPWDTVDNLPQNIFEIVIGDIRDRNCINIAMKGIDIVYHLASKTGHDGGSYDYFKDTIVDGTKNLVEAAVKQKVKKFIFFSSTAVYGLPAIVGNIRGLNETNDRNYSEGYGKAKYEAENLVLNASKKGLDYIIIRPTTVYGERDKAGIYQLINVLKKGYFVFIGNGKNKMDYIYVKDILRIARFLEKSKIKNEDFIIGSGKPVTQKQMISIISKKLGKKVPSIFIPVPLALSVASIIKLVSNIFGISPIVFPNRIKVISSDFYFDITKIKKTINYQTQFSFEQGIENMVHYLKAKEKLL